MQEEKEKKYCLCGCGTEVKNKWVRGHPARVNNVSKRADVKEMRRKSMKERHENGIMPEPWNKGKTADTDERLAKAGETWKANLTEDKREQLSNRMKQQWEDGNLEPLRGKDHPNWKGGTSSITLRIRGSHFLYLNWKKPILIRDNFSCTNCKAIGNLEIHHNVERMNEIIKRFIPEDKHELSWDEESVIVEQVEKYHIENNVSGLTLCTKCHDEEHKSHEITYI